MGSSIITLQWYTTVVESTISPSLIGHAQQPKEEGSGDPLLDVNIKLLGGGGPPFRLMLVSILVCVFSLLHLGYDFSQHTFTAVQKL